MIEASSTDVFYDEIKNELRITSIHKCDSRLGLSLSNVLGAVTVAFLNGNEGNNAGKFAQDNHLKTVPSSLAFLALPQGFNLNGGCKQDSENTKTKNSCTSPEQNCEPSPQSSLESDGYQCNNITENLETLAEGSEKRSHVRDKYESPGYSCSDIDNDIEPAVVHDESGVMKLQLPDLSSVVVKQEPVDEEEEVGVDQQAPKHKGIVNDVSEIVSDNDNSEMYVNVCHGESMDDVISLEDDSPGTDTYCQESAANEDTSGIFAGPSEQILQSNYSSASDSTGNSDNEVKTKLTGRKQTACGLCNEAITSSSEAVYHLELHSKSLTCVTCVVCFKSFANVRELQTHAAIHFQNKYFWCPLCRIQVEGADSIKEHFRKLHPGCGPAIQRYHSKHNPTIRSRFLHPGLKLKGFSQRSPSYFKKSFHSSLRMGESSDFGSRLENPTRISLKLEDDPACETISQVKMEVPQSGNEEKIMDTTNIGSDQQAQFDVTDGLSCEFQVSGVGHIANGWSSSRSVDGRKRDKKNFTCSYCETVIQDVPEFMRHVSLHRLQTSSPFSCPVCLKSFSSELSLRKHAVNHVISKIYLCPFCKAEVSRSDNFKRHITMCHEPYAKQMLEHFDSRQYAISSGERDRGKHRLNTRLLPNSNAVTKAETVANSASGFLQYYMQPESGNQSAFPMACPSIPLSYSGKDMNLPGINFSYYQMLKLALDQQQCGSDATSSSSLST